MVDHVGIGDRQDDPGLGHARLLQQALEVLHLRRAVGPGLGVHAVIGGDGDHGSGAVQAAEDGVEPGVEGPGLGVLRGEAVLHEVGGGQVGDEGTAALEEAGAGLQAVHARFGVVDPGGGSTHQTGHVLAGLLHREPDAAAGQPLRQEGEELVLGRHHGHVGAGPGQAGQHGGAAQPAGVVHHDLLARVPVVVVVARDPVHGRRRAGGDGGVVRIREGGHHGPRRAADPVGGQARQLGHDVGRRLQVRGVAAVDADADDRLARHLVAAAVDGDPPRRGQGPSSPGATATRSQRRCRLRARPSSSWRKGSVGPTNASKG